MSDATNEESMVAGAINQDKPDDTISTITHPTNLTKVRDAFEQAEQNFSDADRPTGIVKTIKRALDHGQTIILEGEKVREERKRLQGEDDE